VWRRTSQTVNEGRDFFSARSLRLALQAAQSSWTQTSLQKGQASHKLLGRSSVTRGSKRPLVERVNVGHIAICQLLMSVSPQREGESSQQKNQDGAWITRAQT
jgi:hypothetical protein